MGFNHTIEARNQTVGTTTYNFASWSDGGTQQHTIVVPGRGADLHGDLQCRHRAGSAGLRASECGHAANQPDSGLGGLYERSGGGGYKYPRDRMEQRDVEHHLGHRLRWQHLSACRPTARGSGISQAIYYAKNIKSAAAGTNTVTVTFNTATQYVDIRALEYSGLDLANPFDVGASASGTSNSANSGAVTTDCRSRTHHRSRNDDWWLLGSRQRLHHSRYHFARSATLPKTGS